MTDAVPDDVLVSELRDAAAHGRSLKNQGGYVGLVTLDAAAARIEALKTEFERETVRADVNSALIGAIEREWTGRLARAEAERDALRGALRRVLGEGEGMLRAIQLQTRASGLVGGSPMRPEAFDSARALLASSPASEGPKRATGRQGKSVGLARGSF